MKNKFLKGKRFVVLCLVFVLSVNFTVFAEELSLIPVGKTVGIILNTDGVMVLDTAEFKGSDGTNNSPAKDAGIKAGDYITKVNGETVDSSERFGELTERFGENEIEVEIRRGEEVKSLSVKPKPSVEGSYRMGLWIKDFQSGIGTITFFNPKTKEFAALGHGICSDNNTIQKISGGKVLETTITSIIQGDKGSPGEISGMFSENGKTLGKINRNTDCGIFGVASDSNTFCNSNEILVAKREEVTEGEAKILSDAEGDGVREYSAEIEKINSDAENLRGMIIKITDSKLIEKTGGIIQGMSGSPILQNGKFVGAITHVFVNEPTKGYGIFADKMIEKCDEQCLSHFLVI